MFEALRKKLRNAQPISQPAQANFEQQSPEQPGAGHEAFIQHETGSGTNALQLDRNISKLESQLSQTSDPGLRILLLGGLRNLRHQRVRASGTGYNRISTGSPVPDVGFPMGGMEDYFNPSSDYLLGDFNGPISPKATFEIAGTDRSRIRQTAPRAKPAGGIDPLPNSYFTRDAFGKYPGQFDYIPGRVNTAQVKPSDAMSAGIDTTGKHLGGSAGAQGRSYAPGRTFQFQHTGPDFGPYGRGLTTSDQPVTNRQGSRSVRRG